MQNRIRSAMSRASVVFVAAMSMATSSAWAFNADLKALSFGSTNWISGHISGWAELDPIPTRVTLAGGPVSNQLVTVQFPHAGIQNLYSFTPSANVEITAGPTLSAPTSGNWSYSFRVKLTDNQPGFVEFRMRLAAGAHRFSGSSLQVDGSPGLSKLFVFKPNPKAGAPDLAIVKSGPTSVNPGSIIAYSLNYSNRVNGSTATGVQIIDTLPDSVSFVDSTAGGQPLGNTIIWDLGDVARGTHGTITYRVAVTNAVTTGFSFQNDVTIAEAEDDANYSDNASSVTTVVTGNCIPPSIVTSPADAAICPGNEATFSVLANGSPALNYQWRKNGVAVVGANSATLTTSEAGSFDVVVSNLCGTETSAAAQLLVGGTLVTSQPASVVACSGEIAAFNIVASGNALTYQWRKDEVQIAGATNNLLDNVAAAGNYDVLIGSLCGSTTSDVASLTFTVPVAITGNPADAVICAGNPTTLSVSATGSGSITYQWRKDGADIVGANSDSLSTSAAGQYDVIVGGTCNSLATSTLATVTVNVAPAISQSPFGGTYCAAAPVTLSVSATGSSLSYQWRKDGADIVGAINTTLNLAAAAGSYDVVVSGICGTPITSANALIAITPAPVGNGDSFTTTKNTALNIGTSGVLANDTGATSAALLSDAAHGAVTLNADGSFSYQPAAQFSGTDSFTYTAVNDCGLMSAATVLIEVQPTNEAPVALADSATIAEDSGTQAINVLANDSDADGDLLAITGVTQGAHGLVTVAGSNINYTPNVNFNGSDEFSYTVSDGQGGTAVANVSVTVTAVNDAPTAGNDSYQVAEDDSLTVAAPGVLMNDSDLEGASLTAALVVAPAHGSVTLNGNGSFTYLPDDNYNGPDSFTYRASDGSAQSGIATVSLDVLAISGAGDIDLYVKTARVKLNWAETDRDTISVRGQINPRGVNDDLTGATLGLSINGQQVLAAMTLDAKGIYSGQIGAAKVKCRLKTSNGAYSVKIAGANLRAELGLTNITEQALTDLDVRLTINNANLEVPTMTAQLESPYKTTADKSTALKFNFRKNRTLSGVFNCNKTAAAQGKTGQVAVTRGAVSSEGGAGVVPTGDITIYVGGDVFVLPLSQLTSSGTAWTYKAPAGTTNGVILFGLSSLKHTFILGVATADLGLPGTGGVMKHELPVQITVPTADGPMIFESIIELKRSSSATTHWKR